MIVKLTGWAGRDEAAVERVRSVIQSHHLEVHALKGVETVVIGVKGIGDKVGTCMEALEGMSEVAQVVRISSPWKFVGKEFYTQPTVIAVNGFRIGADFVVIGGPCSIESEAQMEAVADAIVACGGKFIRGGAFKPRSSAYSFQGLGEEGLKIGREAADKHHLAFVTEVMGVREVEMVARYAHVLQIGARNCQNYDLLREVGKLRQPILLKRGPSVKLEDFLGAAEYIVSGGNTQVVLCVRGIVSFETQTRNSFDLDAVPVLRSLTHLPIIVDPSHAAGRRDVVAEYAYAAAAIGADGVMVETHPYPEKSVSDAKQTLSLAEFAEMMRWLAVYTAITAERRAQVQQTVAV